MKKTIRFFFSILFMFVLLNIFFAQQKLLAMNAPQPPTDSNIIPTEDKPVGDVSYYVATANYGWGHNTYCFYYTNKWETKIFDKNTLKPTGITLIFVEDNLNKMDKEKGQQYLADRVKNDPNYDGVVVNNNFFVNASDIKNGVYKIEDGKVIKTGNYISPPPPTTTPTNTVTPATTPGSGTQGKYVSKYFGTKSFPDYIQELYKWTVAAGILLAVIMLMLAGYTYAISAGDVEKINNAKERIVGAVLGLLVLILAAVILSNLGVTSIN